MFAVHDWGIRMRVIRASALLLALAAMVFAQGERGTITGTVGDPAGAVVAAAAVQAKHVETGTVYDTTTTTTGKPKTRNLWARTLALSGTRRTKVAATCG